MRTLVMRTLAAALLWMAAGCGGASPDPGVGGELYVPGAQFVPGPPPADDGGPRVLALRLSDPSVFPGAHDQPLLGALAPSGTAVALDLAGDRGYFVVGASVPDTEAPDEPAFTAALSFARALAPGARTIEARGVDAGGRVGPPATLAITVATLPVPSGPLVVHLAWDRDADLDLHVVGPAGVEVWSGRVRGDGAALDVDSNGQCRIDGRNQENVVWAMPPAAGRYVVRVDAFSLCGQPFADWRVEVSAAGAAMAAAAGTVVAEDTRGGHGVGAGRLALTFDR
jgi:hypothetical protein